MAKRAHTCPNKLAGVTSPAGLESLGGPHHIALVVPDLEAAKRDLTELVGGWVTVSDGRQVDMRMGQRKVSCLAHVVYSRIGPPHIELIQSAENTVWVPQPRGYMHHVGYWVPADEIESRSRDFEAAGIPIEACRWSDDGSLVGWAYILWPGGYRIELLEWGRPVQIPAPPLPSPDPR